MASERVNIVCVGNDLHGDDGVGGAVWAALDSARLPPGVRLMRAPFVGPAAVACFEDCARVVVVDAVCGFGAAGSVHCLAAGQIAAETAGAGHAAALGDFLATLPLMLAPMPAIAVVGIEAEGFASFTPGLSPPVAAAVPQACRLALEVAQGV
ncbi:MAG: hydrogenase maturation protease [Rhodocyclaceae bacterium]|nr:hydrogenase maturation protease [Rhodocyclaceae bacterium]MCB1963965.1 hydrogenase maturation protease [Rhodocyclaceae bacterium]